MGFLKREDALKAITETAPENTMVVIKPDGHGNADVSVSKIKTPSLYFFTKGVVAPNQSTWYDITTGDQFRSNQFGIFEGFNGNSRVVAPNDRESRFLCHEDAYCEESVEDLREKLDNICRPTLLDYLDWIVVAERAKLDMPAVKEWAVKISGILVTKNQNDIPTEIGCTWGQFFNWVSHIQELLAMRQFGELKPGDPGLKSIKHQAKYDEICIWADDNNISPTQVFAFWGPIRRDTGCTDASLELLKNKIMQSMLERAETAKREVFGSNGASMNTVTSTPKEVKMPIESVPANALKTDVQPAIIESTPSSNAVVTVDTETGEIEMPREEFLWLLKLQDSQLDSFATTELENVDKLLWACNVLTSDCFRLANLATAAINKNLSFMAGLLYKFGGGLREYTEPKLKKGTKTWKSPNLTGSVHYKKTGGWKCTNKSELIEHARKMTDEQIEKCPWARIDVVIDQKAANKWVKKNNEKLPGYELIPVHETGTMQIGDGKPFSLEKLRSALKSIRISNLTNYIGSDDDDESEEE